MPRRHGNHGTALRQERLAERLHIRSDNIARRSARDMGVAIGFERMATIRKTIASRDLPDWIRPLDRPARDREAFVVNLGQITVVALYDPRGSSVTSFEPFDERHPANPDPMEGRLA